MSVLIHPGNSESLGPCWAEWLFCNISNQDYCQVQNECTFVKIFTNRMIPERTEKTRRFWLFQLVSNTKSWPWAKLPQDPVPQLSPVLFFRNTVTRISCVLPATTWTLKEIPWRRKWQPNPIFLPGKFYGQRSISSPSLFCKRIWHPDPSKVGFFWDTSWPFSWTAGFPDKVVFLASTPHFLFTGLLCSKQSKLEIGNKSDEPTRRLAACG